MATRRLSLKERNAEIIAKADKFDKPTFLINCMQGCPICKNLYPVAETGEFAKYLKEKGYDLYINKEDAKSTYNWNKYGRPIRVNAGTPQFYAINGEDVAGKCPSTVKYTLASLCKLADELISKLG